tara:strand:+ start:882 stop:1616 length:735 start_codon:yes stop_codon:yes gene_type:complete
MKDLAMVTWTHSSYNDVFPAYFGNVKKYFKDLESSYVLINSLSENIDDDHLQLVNSESDSYASRWLGSLEHIEEDYILYMQEDFILYDYVDVVELNKCIDYLKNSECSCLRFIRSTINSLDNKEEENIYKISHSGVDLSFTHQPSIWKKEHFQQVMTELNPRHLRDVESGGSFAGSRVMSQFKYFSSFYFDESSSLRGGHFDSKVFPYVATALIGGKWNTSQYPDELSSISKEYDINFNERGTV